MNELVEENDISFQNNQDLSLSRQELDISRHGVEIRSSSRSNIQDIEQGGGIPQLGQEPNLERFEGEQGTMLFVYNQIVRFFSCIQKQIKIIIDYRFLIYFLTNLIIIILGIEDVLPLEKVVFYLLSSSVVVLLITLYFCYKDFDHYIRGYARRAVQHDMRILNCYNQQQSQIEQFNENQARQQNPQQEQNSMRVELGNLRNRPYIFERLNFIHNNSSFQHIVQQDDYLRHQQQLYLQRLERLRNINHVLLSSVMDVMVTLEIDQQNPDSAREGFNVEQLGGIEMQKVCDLCPGTSQAELDLDEDKICTICLDGFKLDQKIPKLQCGHLFHKNCLFKWLQIQKVCPNCKKRVKIGDHENEFEV